MIEVAAGEAILDPVEQSGVSLPHDCRGGACGTCRIRIVAGDVTYDEPPLALSAEEMAEGYALACQGRPASDLVISVPPRPRLAEPQVYDARLRELRAVSPGVWREIGLPEGDVPGFAAGQYMNVLLPGGATRSFSMASPPERRVLDFYVRQTGGGRFTDRHLSGLRPGDPLQVEPPLGLFRYHAEDDRPLLMVATGTGIAPLRAMLEAVAEDPFCSPVMLYWGVGRERDLFLHDEMLGFAQRLPDWRYVAVLSRDRRTAIRHGYGQDAVMSDIADLSEFAVYLCGSPNMIADARRCLLARGAMPAHLYSEGFLFRHQTDNSQTGDVTASGQAAE